MLVLRYLLIKGVKDIVDYVKDEFNAKTLELLSLTHTEIYNRIEKENLTYLSAIGILDAYNSSFLYDYLIRSSLTWKLGI